jgi:hypothetical protein
MQGLTGFGSIFSGAGVAIDAFEVAQAPDRPELVLGGNLSHIMDAG